MAESKNNFLKSKMNKDMDNRLVPAGEYRDAVNLNTSRSEGSNVGTVENLLGNRLSYLTKLYDGDENTITIGALPDEKGNRIFWFVTNFTDTVAVPKAPYATSRCAILMHRENETTQPIVLVQGHFLNFSKNHLITGINLVENLLFWTDGFNQPRRINVEAILSGERTYITEEQLSIIRYSPYLAPKVENLFKRTDTGNINDYLLDKFVRLSYRYKFKDNEYSIIAPFTQILFVPRENGKLVAADKTKIIHTALVSSMINDIASVKISVQMPSSNMPVYYHVTGIEILLKSADSTAIKVIDYIDFNRNDFAVNYTTSTTANVPTSIFVYTYNGNKPYKTLPESQYSRTYDNVPVKAMAQEVAGSRIIYGNYVQNIQLPKLNYSITIRQKSDIIAGETLIDTIGTATGGKYPQHSLKQKRPYSVGVVLSDIFGRQSSVILPINAKNAFVYAPYLNSSTSINPIYETTTDLWNGTCLAINFGTPVIGAESGLAISSPYSSKVKLVSCDSAVVNNYTLTLTSSSSLLTTGINNGLVLGQYLKGIYTENTEIIALSQSGTGPYTTTVTCKLPISTTEYTTAKATNVSIGLFKYIININGWHSYKIVVKQVEQDYYNVYNMQGISVAPAADTTYKSYLSLHGDNMNKIPRASMDVNRDSGITVSKQKIYSKVTISSGIPIQQNVTNKEAINILSVGTPSEYAISNASIYELSKNNLQAEIYDLNREFGTVGTGSQITPLLTVYETKPAVSSLDIYWETSTSGLVEDINYLLADEQENGETPPSLFFFSNLEESTTINSFPESTISNTFVNDLKIKYQLGNFTLTNIEIDSIKNGSNTVITNPLTYFEIVLNSGNYRIRLTRAYRYSGLNLPNQTFKFALKVTTQNPAVPTDTRTHYFGAGYDDDATGLTLSLTNINPFFNDLSGYNTFQYRGSNASVAAQSLDPTTYSARNGSALQDYQSDDIVYSVNSIERFTDENYAYNINCTSNNSPYPNWANSTAAPVVLNSANLDWFDSTFTTDIFGVRTFSISKINTTSQLLNLVPNARYRINLRVSDCNNGAGALVGNASIIYDHNDILINGLQWTLKNANISTYRDGTAIPRIDDQTTWKNAQYGAWCWFENNSAYEPTYGKIYNGYAVLGIYDTLSLNNTNLRKQFAPVGYRMPTGAEFNSLNSFLGVSEAGLKLKEAGTTQAGTGKWVAFNTPYNSIGNNISGFRAFPNAQRDQQYAFDPNGYVTGFWSNTGGTGAMTTLILFGQEAEAWITTKPANWGFGVRFIKE